VALFVKRPIVGDTAPLYTTGMEKTLLIIGLGNIGKEYEGTRHNIGFAVIDNFAEKQGFPGWTVAKDRKCAETSMTVGSSRVILCKPTTFMNLSGEALQAMQQFYKIPNSSTLAIYDEVDVDFGQIRTRLGGGAAGHNGIKSLIQHNGEDFGRLRIGIGPKKPAQIDLADFVLGKFTKKEQDDISMLLRETNSLLSEYAYSGGQLLEETRTFLI
jgi:PTH1 family peptidyl-tRNA hydrolase